jgi:magnesium transporter
MNGYISNFELRDEGGNLQHDFLRKLQNALDANDIRKACSLTQNLHSSDLADLLELLSEEHRKDLIVALGDSFDVNVLPELEERVRDHIVKTLPNEQIAEAVHELQSDDAVYLLEDLEHSEQSDILSKLPAFERGALERTLKYPEDSAGRLMQLDFIAVPPFWSVGQTIDYMREAKDLPDNFSEIFAVGPKFHLRGFVPLSTLLRTGRKTTIEEIMTTDIHPVSALEDQEEVAIRFERYNLFSAPVIDDDERLVGIITVDDVVEVLQEEAREDIHLLGGVGGDESIADKVLQITRGRFSWLFVNLVTSVLASVVIKQFDATIEQMVALAVLMPIVASMGGNAATQTMTVAVRALATHDLGPANAVRIIYREFIVGVLNGLMFALIMGVVALLWFGSGQLGLVIAAAMLFNMLVAGIVGIIIPITLDRFKTDPAVASSVLITTVTDVIGFFAFLGLATLWLV